MGYAEELGRLLSLGYSKDDATAYAGGGIIPGGDEEEPDESEEVEDSE